MLRTVPPVSVNEVNESHAMDSLPGIPGDRLNLVRFQVKLITSVDDMSRLNIIVSDSLVQFFTDVRHLFHGQSITNPDRISVTVNTNVILIAHDALIE